MVIYQSVASGEHQVDRALAGITKANVVVPSLILIFWKTQVT